MRKAVSDLHDRLFYLERALALDHFKPHPDAEFIDLSPNGCQATLLDRFWTIIGAGQEPIIGQNGITSADTQTDRGVFQCETGGTSGKPKRIRRTAESWLTSIRVIFEKFPILRNVTVFWGIWDIRLPFMQRLRRKFWDIAACPSLADHQRSRRNNLQAQVLM